MKYFRRDVKHQTNQELIFLSATQPVECICMNLFILVNNDWRVLMKQHKFTLHFIFFLIQKGIIFFIYDLLFVLT